MMLTKGMTTEQMTEMIKASAWEVLSDEKYEEEEGSSDLVIWQTDHAVAVEVTKGVVTDLQYVPAWAL